VVNEHEQILQRQADRLDALTLFGLFAVSFTLVCYALEKRGHWLVLGFAAGCALSSAYGFLQGAWPFGVVEIVWTAVALQRWWRERAAANRAASQEGEREKSSEANPGA